MGGKEIPWEEGEKKLDSIEEAVRFLEKNSSVVELELKNGAIVLYRVIGLEDWKRLVEKIGELLKTKGILDKNEFISFTRLNGEKGRLVWVPDKEVDDEG